MEKKKKSIVIGLTSLLLVTLLLLGLTYAYYKTKIVGNSNEKSVSVVSKNLSVTYQNESAVINAEGIEPGYTATKTFEVKNTGSETVEYSVMLDNVTNTFTRLEDWTYTISVGGTTLKEGTLPKSDSYILYSENIDAGETKNYTLVINYVYLEDVDQSEDMGASLSFRINIAEKAITWDTATSGTLLYAIKTNQPSGIDETIPGQEGSIETEARILNVQDDYGTSYVYRGNVTNNYVNYSEMCWRIVRVQGDGTIKIVLADENGECDAETYSTSNTKSALVNNGQGYSYRKEIIKNLNEFSYEESDIPKILSDWSINNKNKLDLSKLINNVWCNDTTKNRSILNNPTLKCDTKGKEGTKGIESRATKYVSKLGILSADEIVYAGKIWMTYVKSYLDVNASYNPYWTMTPMDYYFYYEEDHGQFVSFSMIMDGLEGITYEYGASVRPAVVLASNVEISSGNGTQTNPYVIN